MEVGENKLNRLEDSKSPYLKAHAANPIEWYPWGEEAFEKAIKEDKLIFLSIGYSSCRWCHKMNRDCFSSEEIAEILKEDYVSIKVDKEERPDIDKLYMLFSEALTGVTGWPLNLILTPERVPIFAGNYMTVDGEGKDIGLKTVLNNVNTNWNHRREDILKKSKYIKLETDRLYNTFKKGQLNREVFDRTRDEIYGIYDWKNGGFYESPKFLLPQYSLFLLKYYIASGQEAALRMAEDNLYSMYKGSIYDHVAGGFFRYSNDIDWNKPHFEKMIGENSIMTILYATAYQVTGEEFFKDVAKKSFKFILRDLGSPEGAFYTSIDAEFDGVEGKLYFLDYDEVLGLLGKEIGGVYVKSYNIDKDFKSLPNLEGKSLKKIEELPLESINDMLYEYRKVKGQASIDRKILASMNGMAVGALAYAGSIFKDKFLIDKARQTMEFIIDNMIDEDQEIRPIYIDGEVYGEAVLLDYAYVLFGLINIYISTDEERYLDLAKGISRNVKKHFWDEDKQAIYLNRIDEHDLILDLKDNSDGSIGSSSGVMAYNWVKLYKITGDSKYYMYYRNMISSYSGDIIESPNAHVYSIISMFFI